MNKIRQAPSWLATREIATIFTAGAVMGVIVQFMLLSKLTTIFGEFRLIYWTLFFAALSLVFMLLDFGFIYILMLSIIFFTAQSLLRPVISTLISKRATEDEQGYVAGLGNTYMSVGNILGPITAGILYDMNASTPYYLGAFTLILGIILFAYSERANHKHDFLNQESTVQPGK